MGWSINAQSAGVSVSELMPLSTVLAAMVKANCLYNCPEIPLTSMVGINTASNTSTTPTMGPVISPIASVTACRAVYRPVSNRRVEFSTTTMASSTTIATANISPNNVKVLIEKPNNDMIANVPISETGIVIQGMMTARQFCRKGRLQALPIALFQRKLPLLHRWMHG